MTITKKVREVLSVNATYQKRDKHGRFIKETASDELTKMRRVVRELSKRKEYFEDYIKEDQLQIAELEHKLAVKKYVYHVSADYKPQNKGRQSGHSFHMEFQVISPKRLTDSEIANYIMREVQMKDDKLSKIVDMCSFSVAEPEVFEVEYEPEKKVNYTLKSINYKV